MASMIPLWLFDDVVEVLGGPSEVARLCGVASTAVSSWKSYNGRFPPKHYLVIKTELARLGFFAISSMFGFTTPLSIKKEEAA